MIPVLLSCCYFISKQIEGMNFEWPVYQIQTIMSVPVLQEAGVLLHEKSSQGPPIPGGCSVGRQSTAWDTWQHYRIIRKRQYRFYPSITNLGTKMLQGFFSVSVCFQHDCYHWWWLDGGGEQGWVWVQGVSPVCRMVTNSCIKCSSSFHNPPQQVKLILCFSGGQNPTPFCSVSDSNVNYPCSTRATCWWFYHIPEAMDQCLTILQMYFAHEQWLPWCCSFLKHPWEHQWCLSEETQVGREPRADTVARGRTGPPWGAGFDAGLFAHG